MAKPAPAFASTGAPASVYPRLMAHVIDRDKWAKATDRCPDHWQGELQCGAYGSKS
ncbi:hypothetical protein [Mesorhizobium sp.]|uniref:hypothetical protein n=1 Tax=Mesorhizobium sp. TaxID=1871066 RepID=UPI002694B114